MIYTLVDSPIGPLRLSGDGETLSALAFGAGAGGSARRDDAAFPQAREQLEQYFAGERRDFELALSLFGRPFEQRVWEALREIPYGETISYGELAGALGDRSAARAVGLANARNPIAVIVPCHRVVRADRLPGEYGSTLGDCGLVYKRCLLEMERSALLRDGEATPAHTMRRGTAAG